MFEEKRIGKRKSNDEFTLPNSKIASEADQWMETMIVHSSQESLR